MNDSACPAKSIFLEAIETQQAERWPTFLDRACAGDASLRAEVERLLRARAELGTFHEAARFRSAESPDGPVTELPGTVIGQYKLVQLLGEGGMGTVYTAEQSEPVRRRVALKIIRSGMECSPAIARFEAERQAVALMDHPNIAKLFDAGTTAAGRPYFAMELVDGVPITRFCSENRLTPRERMELFIPVCQAVQHAHQKGIIHRDLKPSNVLVALCDGWPVAKVIDFGVAKAAGQQLTEQTLVTGFGTLVGTLEYMSPEQAEFDQLDIDTRSDVYALGVVLYELLTGTTPLDRRRVKDTPILEVLRIIREEELPRPSTRIGTRDGRAPTASEHPRCDSREFCRALRGELDWVVMKALEKDRDRRYETAGALAADVQRYLNNDPVQACPPSTLYKLRKFARRKKAALAVAACAFLALAGVAGTLGWAARERAARDHDQQVRDAALDGEVNRALDQTSPLIEQGKWSEALAAVERADNLLEAAGRSARPARFVKLRNDLALAQRLEDVQLRPKTEEFLFGQEPDAAYAELFAEAGIDVTALSIAEAAGRIRSRSIRRELAQALDFWSYMRQRAGSKRRPDWQQLVAIAEAADPDPWRNRLRQARRRGDRQELEALAASADVTGLPPQTVLLLANSLYENGGTEQAMALLRKAFLYHPDDWWLNSHVGWWCLRAQPPRYDEAIRYYAAAMAVRPRNAYAQRSLGEALAGKKEYSAALAAFSQVIDLKPVYWEAWWNRAEAYLELGQRDKAFADYTHVIRLNPNEAWAWHKRGWAYAYKEPHEFDKAIADFDRAIELNPEFAWSWNDRAWVYGKLGQFDRAIADVTKAIELDPKHPAHWSNSGWIHFQLGQFDRAIADLGKAIELDPTFAWAWHNRGLVYQQHDDWDKALADMNRAIDLDPMVASAWRDRGTIHVGLVRYGKALADFARAAELEPGIALYRNLQAWLLTTCPDARFRDAATALALANKAVEMSPQDARYWSTLGMAQYRAGNWQAALTALEKAHELDRAGERFGWYCVYKGDNFDGFFLAMTYKQLGRNDEAVRSYEQAVRWMEKNAPDCQDLRRYRAEAEQTLGVKPKK